MTELDTFEIKLPAEEGLAMERTERIDIRYQQKRHSNTDIAAGRYALITMIIENSKHDDNDDDSGSDDAKDVGGDIIIIVATKTTTLK